MFSAFRGKRLAEALRAYGDLDAITSWDSSRAEQQAMVDAVGAAHPDVALLLKRTIDYELAAQADLVRRLSSRQLQATGFQMPLKAGSIPEFISSDLWPLFEVDFEKSRVTAHNLTFVEVHILKPIVVARPRKQGLPPEFEASPDYFKVRMRDFHFDLGHKQSNVVRILARVARNDNPWLDGKDVMLDAACTSLRIGDLFKNTPHWRELIEGNGKGQYRLNLRTSISMKESTAL